MTGQRLATAALRLAPVVIPTALLLAFGFFRLDAKSLWFDEIYSVQVASSGFRGILGTAAGGEANMVLYYAVLRVWLALGDGDSWARLPSVVFAVATVPVVYLVGREVAGRTVGGIAATLFAVNAFVVQYAQEARSYSLTMLLVALVLLLALHAARGRGRLAWAGLIAAASLAVYAHFFAGLTVAAVALAVVMARPLAADRRHAVVALGVIGVLVLPLAIIVATRQGGQLGWVGPTSPAILAQTAAVLSGAGVVPGRETAWSWLLVAAVLALALLAAVRARRVPSTRDGADSVGLPLLVLAIVVPLAGALLISLAKPIFIPRFFAVVVPPLVTLVAVGLARLEPRIRAVAFVGLLALALQGVWTWYADHPKTDWRTAVAFIADHAAPGDRYIVYEEWNRRAIQYYAAQHVAAAFPVRVWRGLGAADPGEYAGALEAVLDGEVPPESRVWLVLVSAARGRLDLADPRFEPLRARYRSGPLESFDGLSVVLLEPGPP